MHWYVLLTITSLMIGSFMTCDGSANPIQPVSMSTDAVSASAPTTIATFPSGRFTTTITREDLTNPDLEANIGTWILTFDSKNTATGSYHVTLDDMVIANGKYHLKQNTITFQDDALACRGAGNGRYSWAFDGSSLTFTSIEDRCEPRTFALSIHPYTRLP